MLIILIILLLLALFFWGYDSKKYQVPQEVFFAIILILIAAFRYKVGVDYDAYYYLYEGAPTQGVRLLEPAWPFFYYSLHGIGATYNLWFLITALLIIVPMAYGIHKMSVSPFLSLAIFVASFLYTESFNAMRQYVAMAILFAGLPLLLQGKKVQYAVVIAITLLFHNSGLLGLSFYFLTSPISRYLKVILILVSWTLGELLLNTYLADLMMAFATLFSEVTEKKQAYAYDMDFASKGLFSTGILKIVYNCLALALCMYEKRLNKKYTFFVNAFIVGICWYNLFYLFQAYLRAYQFFMMSILILFPAIVYSVKKTSTRLIVSFVILMIFFAFNARNNWDIEYNINPTYSLFE